MFQQMKKKSVKNGIIAFIICLILAVVFLWFSDFGIFKLVMGPQKLEDIPVSDIKSQYVTVDVTATLGWCTETVETDKNTRKEKSISRAYVIPVGDKEFMTVEVKPADYKMAEALAESTLDMMFGESDSITGGFQAIGGISAMDKEELGHIRDAIGDFYGITDDDELDEYIVPYKVVAGKIGTTVFSAIYGFSVVALVIFLFGLYRLLYGILGMGQNKARRIIQEAVGIQNMEKVEADFANSKSIGGLHVGRDWTVYNRGSKTHALQNKDLVWAYAHHVKRYTNGIPSGTTYGLILRNMKKKKIEVAMKNEAQTLEALQAYRETQQHMVFGYSKDLEQLFNSDFEQFKRLPEEARARAAAEAAAAAPVMANAPTSAPVMTSTGDCRVILTEVGERKIETIKVIRDATGLSLSETMALIDHLPATVKVNISADEARDIVSKLSALGSQAEVQ